MRTVGSILIVLMMVACGGGGGGGNGGPTSPNNPGPGPGSGGPSSSASVSMERQGDPYGGVGSWSFSPATVTIARGGTVTWTNGLNESHNVVFASAAGAPANIPEHQGGSNTRTFSSNGTFHYQCTVHPMAGQVIVQ